MRPSCRLLAHNPTLKRIGQDAIKGAFVYRGAESSSTASSDGVLSGWPVSVKDNICTLDMPTSCSSKMLFGYQSPFEATAVKLFRQAGANIIGKTNCDEFGMGSANLYSIHGSLVNPESRMEGEARVAGGSSGGAAVGAACGATRVALASDTGGSIRIPAAYCGVYGLKPSYGLISRWGLVAYADSLDTVGLISNNCEDIEKAFNVLSHVDMQDPTSIAEVIRAKASCLSQSTIDNFDQRKGPLAGLRVGIPFEFFPEELSKEMLPAVRVTLSKLKAMGAELVNVQMPSTRYALSAYYVLASAEASSNLARYDGVRYGHRALNPAVTTSSSPGSNVSYSPSQQQTPFHRHISRTRSEGFGKEAQKRILLGTYSLTSDLFDNYFLQAQKVRRLIRQDFDDVFRLRSVLRAERGSIRPNGVDVLVTPSTVDIAPTVEEAAKMGVQAYTQDILTVPASLAGVPAMSIPAGRSRNMPVGVTLTTQWGCEKILFEVARQLSA